MKGTSDCTTTVYLIGANVIPVSSRELTSHCPVPECMGFFLSDLLRSTPFDPVMFAAFVLDADGEINLIQH